MQRVIGMILLMWGSIGLSFVYVGAQMDKIRTLYTMSGMMNSILGQLTGAAKTLPEIFEELSGTLPEKMAEGCMEVVLRAKQGEEDFIRIYRDVFKSILDEMNISESLQEPFLNALNGFKGGMLEEAGKQLIQSIKRLEVMAQEEENTYNKKKSLAIKIGVMSGFMLILVFV